MLDKLTIKQTHKPKTGFYASDHEKMEIDLYLALRGVPPTNASEWYDHAKFGAGEGVEAKLLEVLKDSEIVDEHYDQDFDGRIEMERFGVPITGYVDAISKKGNPIEIKTINNKNEWDIRSYKENKPRENYVGQLATYMDYLGSDRGALFVCSIDGLNRFWIEARKISDGIYRCGEVEYDLYAEYKRWATVWARAKEDEAKGVVNPPKEWVNKYRYKIPVSEVDWKKVPVGQISKARNGHKVIGDPDAWKILYSNYKDYIVKEQGASIGYSEEEIEFIKKATAGYSSKK